MKKKLLAIVALLLLATATATAGKPEPPEVGTYVLYFPNVADLQGPKHCFGPQ